VRHIDAVESVQRRFTKRLPGLKHLSYSKRLKCLRIPSLELRRLRADLFWCYEIAFGFVDIKCDEFFVRGHRFKLYKPWCSLRPNFYTERVINIFVHFCFFKLLFCFTTFYEHLLFAIIMV